MDKPADYDSWSDLEKKLYEIVSDDSDNPHIEPTLANPNAWERFQKAKELAKLLEDKGIAEILSIEEERKRENISVIWQSINDEIPTKIIREFVSCFDSVGLDGEAWHFYIKVFK